MRTARGTLTIGAAMKSNNSSGGPKFGTLSKSATTHPRNVFFSSVSPDNQRAPSAANAIVAQI